RGDAVRPADSPWHTQRLNTTVVLDGASPEIVERRRIVSHQDGLTLVDLAVTVSAADGSVAESTDLGVDVLWGGTLVRTLMESSHGIGIALELAEPLAQAQHAEFAVRYRILDDKPIRPHHVCVPRYRCDRFDLRVRFGRDQPPRAVWRLTGAFQNDIDDPAEVGEIVAVDGAGEVHVRFDDLKPGFAYGARWEHSGLSDIAGVG
ncbi:MAG TPA: hypothetical protein VFX16_25675, partial [Pseudonocardiaceae bacterium]|nr:hypothetical protein [Pseudonocardiaceae bacterium]